MAIVWADFPGGQRGLYGTEESHMLNGVWAGEEGAFGPSVLVDDPDPNIGSSGVVLKTYNDNILLSGYRFALPAGATTTVGIAVRLWLDNLPASDWGGGGGPLIGFRTTGNVAIAYLTVLANGAIAVSSTSGSGGLLGPASAPCVVANAYNHIEVKLTRDAAAGVIEARVNGTEKLDLTGLALGANDNGIIFLGSNTRTSPTPNCQSYWKDLVIWDTSGAYANDFQGSVAVYDLFADADVSLNWVPSIGALGYPLITDNFPSNTLTVSGLISDGDTVRIDNTYYRFSSGTLDSGAPAGTAGNPWRVLIGATNADSMLNLYKAIGATGVAGTNYSTALTAHTTVNADGVTATKVSVEAKLQTASAIVTTETGANLAWVAGTLTGGPTDPSYIEADATPPAAAVFTMTNLPPDVTSVRALIPIMRGMKTDGGDCNVQAGLSPDNATWVNGADRPMTTAFTYYWSPIHTNPVTAAPWTPGAVNGAYVRVNRTL